MFQLINETALFGHSSGHNLDKGVRNEIDCWDKLSQLQTRESP